jgi:hypothetical protein
MEISKYDDEVAIFMLDIYRLLKELKFFGFNNFLDKS